VCGSNAITLYPVGAYGGDVQCRAMPAGISVGVGAGLLTYGTFVGVGAGGYWCYPASNPYRYACVNPQSFAAADAGGSVFVLNSVCYAPYPCDWVLLYVLPSYGAGVEAYEYANGIYEGVHVPL
jgi:hypothetical protein